MEASAAGDILVAERILEAERILVVEATSVGAATWAAVIERPMQHRLVMTIIGPDRPGLVDSVAGLVEEHKGNWLESRMSRLGGFFAGILRVEVPHENEQRLR